MINWILFVLLLALAFNVCFGGLVVALDVWRNSGALYNDHLSEYNAKQAEMEKSAELWHALRKLREVSREGAAL